MALPLLGSLLPLMAATAFSPFPIVGVTVVLGGPRASTSGPAFTAGWMLGLTALTAIGAFVSFGSDEPTRLGSGERVIGLLADVRAFMIANNHVILMVVFALLGATLLGDGLAGW